MARRKHVKRIDPRYFLHETVNRGEELEEKRIGSMLDPKTYKHPDPEDPNWPWKPGDSVEGNRPHPYEAEPVMGSIKRRPGESREEYERRIRKGKHRAQYRLPDEGELDPYELEESWADDDAGGYDRQWKVEQGYKVKGPHVPAKNSREEQEERARERRRRRVRGGELEEGCPHAEEGDALDISSPGIEVHVDDISNLPPEEAFAAGLAAAKDAIDHMLSGPEQVPPEGGGALQEIEYDPRGRHVVPTPGAASPQMVEWMTKHLDDLQASLDSLGERRDSALRWIVGAREDRRWVSLDGAETALKRQGHSLESAQKTMEFLRETVPASRFEEE